MSVSGWTQIKMVPEGASTGQIIVLCMFLTRTLNTFTVPLSMLEYKWVLANYEGDLTKYWRVSCSELASPLEGRGGVVLAISCCRNCDKL